MSWASLPIRSDPGHLLSSVRVVGRWYLLLCLLSPMATKLQFDLDPWMMLLIETRGDSIQRRTRTEVCVWVEGDRGRGGRVHAAEKGHCHIMESDPKLGLDLAT